MKPAYIGALAGAAALAAVGIAVVGGGNDSPETKPAATQQKKQADKPARPRPIRWFVRADANRDGKLAKAELLAFHERFFNDVDVKKTGVITQADIHALNAKKAADRAKREGKPAPVVDPKAKPRPIRWFMRADKNRDGKLTKAEFFAPHEAFFVAVDISRKGFMTQDDIRAHDARKRAEREAARKAKPQPAQKP